MSWASTTPVTGLGSASLTVTPTLHVASKNLGWTVLDGASAYGKIRDSYGFNGALVLEELSARPVSDVGTQLQAQVIAELLRTVTSAIRGAHSMPDDLVDITFQQRPRETRRIMAKVVRRSAVRRALVVDEDIV